METKFTQGPWRCESGRGEYFPSVFIGVHQPEIVINAGGGELEEHEANARLIAAAPEMFALLERMTNAAERRLRELRALNSIDALQLTNDIADARALLAKVNNA